MYVGAVPTTGDFKKLDSITTSSSTTFNLRQGSVAVYPQSANHCIVSLNGVIQAPIDAFTIVNDTIVFASSLASSDVINFILVLGNVNDIGVPSDDTVSTAKIQADAINASKIVDDAISEEHLDVTAITGHPEKTSIVDADKFLISDSAASGALKYIQNSNLGGAGLVLLESIDASNTATVEFTSFPATYYNYMIYFSNVDFQNNDEYMAIRAQVGGASGVRDGGNDYGNSRYGTRTNGDGAFTDLQTGDANYSMINFNNGIAVMSGDWEIHGYVHIWNPNSSHYKMISHRTVYGVSGNNMSEVQGSGVVYQNGALTKLQFMTENGENYSGNFRLYGIKK